MKKTYHISGMHCASCETLLEQEISEIPGVRKAKASHRKGTLEIEAKKKITDERVQKAVEKCGYALEDGQTRRSAPRKNTLKDYIDMGSIALLFFLLFFVFSALGITELMPDASGNATIGMAFLVGLVASVSTCLALTGGIVMSFSAEMKTNNDLSLRERSRPQLFFHFGRVGGFFLFGGLLGLLGETLSNIFANGINVVIYYLFLLGIIESPFEYSGGYAHLTIVVALVMLYIGLHILKILPSLSGYGFKGVRRRISNLQKNNNPLLPALIGVLTFFLPCGFTISMQIAAVASGSFWLGGLIMAMFALGTLPVLFGIGMGTSYATAEGKKTAFFKKAIGVLIVLFGIYSLHSGLVLSGARVPSFSLTPAAEQSASEVMEEDGAEVQVVRMDINGGFSPSTIRIQKDVPVRFEIKAVRVSGCTDEVIIPSLNLSTGKLKNGDTAVLEFTPTKSGTLPFSCWMGMVTGKFIVE